MNHGSPANRLGLVRRLLSAAGGPVLIVGAALWLLRGFAFDGRITTGDAVHYWLPLWDFLGQRLKAGHIPAWNPFALSGTPFAADPQSGWMYFPVMLLFGMLRPDLAIRWAIVIQPVIAGLGAYAFLRSEGAHRVAASVGGVGIMAPLATANVAVSLRFPGSIAWTMVTLAAASRYEHATRWSRRLLWAVPTGLAWMQIAAAHMTVGLVIGSLALAAYLIGKAVESIRAHRRTVPQTIGALATLTLSLPCVALAFFLPRLALSGSTNIALGYRKLQELSLALGGDQSGLVGGTAPPKWPLTLSTVPGRYLGAAVLLLALAAFWSRRHRALAVAFALYGAVCYVLGLRVVVDHVPAAIARLTLVDQYLHRPYWISYGLLVAVATLAGIGAAAWLERRPPLQRTLMLLPGLFAWLVLPAAFGAGFRGLLYMLVGGAVTILVLFGAAMAPKRTGAIALLLIPVVLVGEIVASTVFQPEHRLFTPSLALLRTDVSPGAQAAQWVAPTRLSEVLAAHPGGRFVSVAVRAREAYVGKYLNLLRNEGMLFDIETVGGYQAFELQRYWLFVRTLSKGHPVPYNLALFPTLAPTALNLLDVHWVIASPARELPSDFTPTAQEGPWVLYRREPGPGRVSLVGDVRTVAGPSQALAEVSAPGFDPSGAIVLEQSPDLAVQPGSGASPGAATYRQLGDQRAEVTVDATSPSMVLIRNVWDPNWHATLDGHPAPLLVADYVDQAVAVPPGRHTIDLRYDDPTIGRGLIGSAAAILGLVALALVLAHRERRRAVPSPSDDGDQAAALDGVPS